MLDALPWLKPKGACSTLAWQFLTFHGGKRAGGHAVATHPLFWVVADVWEGRTSGTPRPSLGVQVLALLFFLAVQKMSGKCAPAYFRQPNRTGIAPWKENRKAISEGPVDFFYRGLSGEKVCKYIRNLFQKRNFVGTSQRLARIRTRMRSPKTCVRFASEEEIWVVVLGPRECNAQ